MRRPSVAWLVLLVILVGRGPASAQQLNVAASLSRVDPAPAATIAIESSPQPGRTNGPRATRILDDSVTGDPATAGSQILERLPIGRLQRLLKKNAALRVAETAVGATLVAVQWRRADADSTMGQIGVHAIRFGGAEWLERSRFHVEPQIIRGGFAVYVKKNN